MNNVQMPQAFEPLSQYLVGSPQPILTRETIQVVLMREALDYAILRTEETREINKVLTPVSVEHAGEQMERVAFLGGKQKAVESRELAALLRTAAAEQQVAIHECWLKDHLCLQCPRCVLYGGTNASSYLTSQNAANINHRVGFSTAYSLAAYHDVEEAITFNAVDAQSMKTGQALGLRNVVKPATLFPSIVSLQCVTWKELMLVLKAILGARRYGAESRTGGDMRNTVFGIVAGWEEVITSLELTLELYDRQVDGLTPDTVAELLGDYADISANRGKIRILTSSEVEALINAVRQFDMDREFLETAYSEAEAYRSLPDARGQNEKITPRPTK